MRLLLFIFGFLPFIYYLMHGLPGIKFDIYAATIFGLSIGFIIGRFIIKSKKHNYNLNLHEKNSNIAVLSLLSIMTFFLIMAMPSIISMGIEYRVLFFEQQAAIFGFEKFGLLFSILTEYAGISLFSIILANDSRKKWKYALIAWAILGTAITFGRWYILYAIIIYIITDTDKNKNMKIFYISVAIIFSIIANSLIFSCRGSACSLSNTEDFYHGLEFGVTNYLLIPIDMIDEYGWMNNFTVNLLIGFSIYPFYTIGKITGIYEIDYEYDKWTILIQDYVKLDNAGSYNALVGQPLTSYLAAGIIGIIIPYMVIGFLTSIYNKKMNYTSPLVPIATTVGASSYFIPSISGPMMITCMISYFIYSKLLMRHT